MQRRVTALLAAVLALGGCSRTDEPASAPTAVEVGGASGGELAESQILHLGNGAEIQTLDPHRGEEVETSVIDGNKSVIWKEAFHRRTTIQALLYHLIRGELKGN